jgi:hypothetical protein
MVSHRIVLQRALARTATPVQDNVPAPGESDRFRFMLAA